uniref:ATP-dependent RNA helicase DHX36 isoform X2 n=1 Tax=Rhizophora mucronata TaxID=61149 RepID=A0A2P2KTB4_RHIMU
MTGYRLTPYNQIDDYGQEKMWRTSKQAPRKRKSQIASAVEVCDILNATVGYFAIFFSFLTVVPSFWLKNIIFFPSFWII